MKTKAEIVQRLLDESKITAEEAVVLLMSEKIKEYVYLPNPEPLPYVHPWGWPVVTYGTGSPAGNSFPTYCSTELSPPSSSFGLRLKNHN